MKTCPGPPATRIDELTQIHQFLAKFLPQLAQVSLPLRDLTTKNAQFVRSSLHDRAFTEVKRLVSNHPVLKYYDINEEVTLQCDASEKGLGATLLQSRRPVAFASQTLSTTERRYAQIEECLVIVFSCKKFSQYITRTAKVTVESDHNHCNQFSRSPFWKHLVARKE